MARLPEAVNPPHVHPRLGGPTPAQHRRGLPLQKLPARFVVPAERLPLAGGRGTFLRKGGVAGTVRVLSQTLRVGKRHRGRYRRRGGDTGRGRRTAYLKGRVRKRWPSQLRNDEPTPNPAAAVGSRRHSGGDAVAVKPPSGLI